VIDSADVTKALRAVHSGFYLSDKTVSVGVIGAGVVGGTLIGAMQEDSARVALQEQQPGVYQTISKRDSYLLGSYQAIDAGKLAALPAEKKAEVEAVATPAKQGALSKMTLFPLTMLACYIGLMLYFRSRGGYKPVDLAGGGH